MEKVERNQVEDIFLLRYEKGAKVARVLYPEKGPFKDMVHFEVYGATIMATNEPVHHILDTRCIPIAMPNKPVDYENLTPDKAQELKERLTAWRARVMTKPLPDIEAVQGLNGRLWDISRPLIQVCQMVSRKSLNALEEAIFEIARQRVEDKAETIEGQILSVISDLSPDGIPEWVISVQNVLDKINEKRPEGHKLTPQYIGRKLRGIGLKTRKVHGRTEVLLNEMAFNALATQYGLIEKNTLCVPCKKTLPNATTRQNSINSIGYPGRELVELGRECQETLPITLPDKSEQNQEVIHLVESGRVSLHMSHKKKSKEKGEVIDLTNMEVEVLP